MADPRLPALRTNTQNRALTTTVYAPRQSRELELLPRYHQYAFQEPETRASRHGDAGGGRMTAPAAVAVGAARRHFCEGTDADLEGDDSTNSQTARLEEPLSTGVQLFRPRAADQCAAITAARRAMHRYRAAHGSAGTARTDSGSPESSEPIPVPPLLMILSDARGCSQESTATSRHRDGLLSPPSGLLSEGSVFHTVGAFRAGLRLGDSQLVSPAGRSEMNGSLKAARGRATDDGRGRSRLGAPLPSSSCIPRDPCIDAAMRALQPDHIIGPYLRQQQLAAQLAAADRRGAEATGDDGVTGRSDGEKGEGKEAAAPACDPNAAAVRRLFARQQASGAGDGRCGEDTDVDDDLAETQGAGDEGSSGTGGLGRSALCPPAPPLHPIIDGRGRGGLLAGVGTSSTSSAVWQTSGARGHGLPPLPEGPAPLIDLLVSTRLLPHVRGRTAAAHTIAVLPAIRCSPQSREERTAPVAAANSSAGAEGESSPRCGERIHRPFLPAEQSTRFLSACRWLLYEEQFDRRLIEHAAAAQSPVPWLVDDNLDIAAAAGTFPVPPHCILHEMDFTSDEVMHTAVADALQAFYDRLRHANTNTTTVTVEEATRRRSAGHEVDASYLALLHQQAQDRMLRQAEEEKDGAFHAALGYRATIPQLLKLVQEEKQARLSLLGTFASCTWPQPCRCLRWDAEILEDSAIPLSPTLYPLCVFVSVVLGRYEVLQEELLAQRASELQRWKQRHELEFIALHVRKRVAEDEAEVFRHIDTFHGYCMTVAALMGEEVPRRFANTTSFSVFEQMRSAKLMSDNSVLAAQANRLQRLHRPLVKPHRLSSDDSSDPTPEEDDGEMDCDPSRSVEGPPPPPAETTDGGDTAAQSSLSTPGDEAASAATTTAVTVTDPVPPAPAYLGPLGSPFCRVMTFIELLVVHSVAIDSKAALANEEASYRYSLMHRLACMRDVADLESQETVTRHNAVARCEAEERARLSNDFVTDAAEVQSAVAERQRCRARLARIEADMAELVRVADVEHVKHINECLEAFTAVHQKEARARRWAQLRDRQAREDTGAMVAATWAFEHELAVLVTKEDTFRRRYFMSEKASWRVLQDMLQLSWDAFALREQLLAEEAAAFAVMLLTVWEEGKGRRHLQHTYAFEQFSLFGKVVEFDSDLDDDDDEDDAADGGENTMRLSDSGAGCLDFQRVMEDAPVRGGNRSVSHRLLDRSGTPNASPSRTRGMTVATPSFSRAHRSTRRRSKALWVLDEDAVHHPLEGALTMQRVAVYGLYNFIPNHELLDLFSR